MAEKFIKLISELREQRYAMQLQNLISNQTPIGIFSIYNNEIVNNVIEQMKKLNVNLQFICTLDKTHAEKIGGVRSPS